MTTTVLFAGKVSGKNVVSIFSNPEGQAGSNIPLTSPIANLNRVYFDSRFEYLNIISETTFIQNYPEVLYQGTLDRVTREYTISVHNLGYRPACMLIDYDTREVIASNMFVQIVNDRSYRKVGLLADDQNFYIREQYLIDGDDLPALTRRYTLLTFNNTAEVPAISN